jgi:hypothetical protein
VLQQTQQAMAEIMSGGAKIHKKVRNPTFVRANLKTSFEQLFSSIWLLGHFLRLLTNFMDPKLLSKFWIKPTKMWAAPYNRDSPQS